MLDFRIDTFLAVCRRMNFTRAAREMNISQPAVSQHIRALEASYGVKLLLYQGKKLSLTPAGRELLNAATTMKRDALSLRERMARISQGEDRLSFGATLTIGEFVMPPVLARYLRRHPRTDVRMLVNDTERLLRELDDGGIDFAIVEGFFPRGDYDSLVYARERFLAVCSPRSPAAGKRAVEELLAFRLLVREAGSGTRKILETYLESRNLSLHDFSAVSQLGNPRAIRELAAGGCGVTFLYEAAARRELAAAELAAIPLEDFPLTRDFSFIWRRGSICAGRCRALFRELLPERGTEP